jgi:hypothetical protein
MQIFYQHQRLVRAITGQDDGFFFNLSMTL